jgi:hypothetical protein
MARKPNYRFERAERERLQAARRVKREERKSANRAHETDPAAAEPGATDERQDP